MQAIAAPALTAPATRGRHPSTGAACSQNPACQKQRQPPPANTTASIARGSAMREYSPEACGDTIGRWSGGAVRVGPAVPAETILADQRPTTSDHITALHGALPHSAPVPARDARRGRRSAADTRAAAPAHPTAGG